jgi:TRAP-type C4-dicarboxylate transport system permease large subunit/TRAP-type C4-dicarboxylate transport system permease small subunit
MTTGRNSQTETSPPKPDLVGRLDRLLQGVEGYSIFVLLMALVAMTFLQVVLRNLPGNPSIPWIDLAARLVVLWVGLLGASLAVAREKHISIDIAGRLLPQRSLRLVKGITGSLSLLVILVLFHASLNFTLAKHDGASLPLFTIDSLGLKVFEWFFTDLVAPIFLFMLWHTWVRWRWDLGTGRGGRIAALFGGILVLVSALVIAAVDFQWVAFEGLTELLSTTLGALVKSGSTLFLLAAVVLALLGAPLFVVIAAVALIGHFAIEEIPVQNFVADGIGGFRKSTIFLAIPLFTLAGYLMAEGKTPQRLVGLFRGFLGWMPGGVAIVALIACSFFTAFTGASGVTIIALGGLLLPILLEDRYPEKFALGLLTTGGSRGLIFPPAIPVFLLAMIMGLSWDAVTATGPFGSAVMPREQRQQLCRREIDARKAELILDAQPSAGDDEMEDEIDRLLQERLEAEGIETPDAPAGDDEFELGDDDAFGAGASDSEPVDEFELGDDSAIAVEEPAPQDEFELGDDEAIDVAGATAKVSPPDEFELGEDEAIDVAHAAGKVSPEDEFELGDDAAIETGEEAAVAGGTESAPVVAEGGVAPGEPVVPPPEEATIAVPSSTQIFTAGLIPGLLMVLAIAAYCIILGFRSKVVRTRFSPVGAGKALLNARWELPIPILIGVGIFGGYFTPAEAASATAAYTLVMQLVLYRDFGWRTMVRTFVDSMVLVGGILIILVAAMGLLNFLVVAKVPDAVLSMIENVVPEELSVLGLFAIPRQIIFLLMLNLFLLVVGCLMDIFSAILVVLPLLLPIAYRFGIHPAHLAVIFLTNLEIGYSTPPVGINLFVASLRFDRPVVKLYAASLAFLAIMFAGLLVITYWPGLSLWLVEVTGVQ